MSFNCCRQFLVGVALLSGCANERVAVSERAGVRASPLALTCADAPADLTGDVTAILFSEEPSQPSDAEQCDGLIFEFDNPDEEELRGAWIQAGADTLDERACSGRALEADYWGYEKRAWTMLASVSAIGALDPGTGYCRLEGLIQRAGAFEKLRIVARVTQGAEPYPMYACVW